MSLFYPTRPAPAVPEQAVPQRDLAGASWLFVCVEGVDCGAVIALTSPTISDPSAPGADLRRTDALFAASGPALSVHASHQGAQVLSFGRCLPVVTDPHVSRVHCKMSWVESARGVWVRECDSLNGVLIHRTLRGYRRHVSPRWTLMRPWDVLVVGESRWQLRPRPHSLLLPAQTPATGWWQRLRSHRTGANAQLNAGGMKWRSVFFVLPLIFIILSLGRLARMIPPQWLALVGMLLLSALVGFGLRRRSKALTDVWDAGLLAMHLSHCTHHPSSAGKNARKARAASFPWRDAHELCLWEDGSAPRTPGYYGGNALTFALWDIAANARAFGGARVWTAKRMLVCGNGEREVHLMEGAHCPHCQGQPQGEYGHVAVATTCGELPAWCDTVIDAARCPVSASWVAQVYRDEDSAQHCALELPSTVYAADLWETSPPPAAGTLSTPIGVNLDGPITVDLISDGPHGVIVGTTGSGKSEALITVLMGLCVRYSPHEVQLIAIDYKGGASLGPLTALPHTHDLLTDLETAHTERAFLGIRSLMEKREHMLRERGYASVKDWQEAEPTTAPSRIIIACDEFTTFADLHPSLFDDMLRWTAQGRALGIHILLATQRPDRALAPAILANIDLRIALRCREASASRTLVGSDEASHLPAIPGRAILETHGALQCAWIPDPRATSNLIRERWPHQPTPLWSLDLPTHMSTAEARCFVSPSQEGAVMGVLDGIRSGQHCALTWTGGHIRFEGQPHDQHHIATSVIDVATILCSVSRLALVVCADDAPVLALDHTHISLEEPCALVDFLANTEQPSIVCIPDLERFRSTMDDALGPIHGHGLWAAFSRRAAHQQITLVVGTTEPTTQWDKDGRLYAYRFVGAHTSQALTHWGLDTRTPHSIHPQHYVLAVAPATTPLPVPALAVIPHPTPSDLHAEPTAPPTSSAVPTTRHSPASESPLYSDEGMPLEPLAPSAQEERGEKAAEVASCPREERLIIAQNPPAPLSPQWEGAQHLAPAQWAQIPRHNPSEVLTYHLNDDIRRALLPLAHRSEWILRLRHLPDNDAIIIQKGRARYLPKPLSSGPHKRPTTRENTP